jgi:hypothetical protein
MTFKNSVFNLRRSFAAYNYVKALLATDATLTSERGEAARLLLRLFNLDEAERLKRAG